MKTILLTVVLGVAVGAAAQGTTQPAQQGQSAPPTGSVNPPTGSVNPPTGSVDPATGQAAQNTPAAAPVIKDPAEYNAYVSAVQQTDPNAKISALEAFRTQYPNSVMKNQALEVLMGAYQASNNMKKTMDIATQLVTADPCNVRGLTLLAFFDRALAQNGDPNAAQLLADGAKYGKQGLDCLPKVTDPETLKNKDTMSDAFHSAIGLKCLQDKDYACATKELRTAVDTNADTQKDFGQVYPLALAYWPDPKTPTTPENSRFAIWYAARASALAPAQAQAQIEKYAHSLYRRFHGDDDGWTDLLAKAKTSPAAPPDLETLIKPAPTPAEQAHKMVQDTTPDKMDFATWEFVLSNGSQDDQNTVWNAIKGKAVQMNGTIISTTPTEFMIAGSSDDIDAKKADITLQFEDKIPVKMIPKDGASFDFQGEPASYTPNPFLMVMDKGTLLKAAAPAAKKPPVHHKPAASN